MLQSPAVKTSYFYCRETDPNQNTSLAILKALLGQLVHHCEDLLPLCYEKCLAEEVLNDRSKAERLIEQFFQVDMDHFVIIDGLDECGGPERQYILSFLNSAVKKADGAENIAERGPRVPRLRVLIVSRDLPDIQKLMKSNEICIESLSLSAEKTQEDISIFVTQQTAKLKKDYCLTKKDAAKVQRVTCKMSDGE